MKIESKPSIFNVALLSVALLVATAASADDGAGTYGYVPGLPVTLGKGFTPKDPMQDHLICFQGIKTRQLNSGVSDATSVSVNIVQTTRDLKSVLGIDEKIDASMLTFSGHESFGFSSDQELNENDVNIVVQGWTEYSGETLDLSGASYIPEIKKLVNDGNLKEVTRRCGVELVNTVRRGASISVIITIHGLSDSEKQSMNLNVSGGGGIGPFSASAEVKVNSLLNGSSSSAQISMQAFARGGAGLSSFAPLVSEILSESKSISVLASGISSALSSLTPENGALIGFSTIPFPYVDLNQQNLISDLKEQKLSDLVEVYRSELNRYEFVHKLFMEEDDLHEHPPVFDHLSPDLIASARGDLPKEEAYLASIAGAHQACLNNVSPGLGACAIPTEPDTNSFNLLYFIVSELL